MNTQRPRPQAAERHASRPSFLRRLLPAAAVFLTATSLQAAEPAAVWQPAHPMPAFLLLLVVLTIAARLGGRLFEMAGLPALLGEVGAGILLGGKLLGGIALPGYPQGLQGIADHFLASPGGALPVVALMALMALAFTTGLESDLRLTRGNRPLGIWIGLGGSLGALLLTAVVVMLFGDCLLEGDPTGLRSPAALYLVAGAAIPSVHIAARTLARLRKLDQPEGMGTISAGAAANMAGLLWMILAAGALAAPSGDRTAPAGIPPDATTAARNLLIIIPACLACWMVARHLNRRPRDLDSSPGTVVLLLGAALLLAVAGGGSGISLLAVSFVAGLTISGSGWRPVIRERLEFTRAYLVPATFALLGMRLDLHLFAEAGLWLFAAAFTAAALAGQMLGGWLPARAAGFNTRGWMRCGNGLLPRGEMALAIVMAGKLSEITDFSAAPEVMALMVLLTSLINPPLLTIAYGGTSPGVAGQVASPVPHQTRFTFESAVAARNMQQRLIELLESDGFHLHLLNRHTQLYQVSRENSVLSVLTEGPTLVVNCSAADEALVNSTMIEVMAEIEQHLRELRRPLDTAVLLRNALRHPATAPRAAGKALGDMLNVNTLRPRLLADTKAAAITELIEMLDDEELISDRHAALRDVIAREEGMPTGLDNGIAIPHARTSAVNHLVCAVGIKQEGIDFGGPHDKPARIIIMLLAPLDIPAPQIQAIAHFSRILDAEGRAALLACDSPEDMLQVLSGNDAAHGTRRTLTGSAYHDRTPLSALQWHGISLDLHGGTKEEIIGQLLALCARSGAVADLAEARRAVLAREHRGSTAMEHGIALPHARTDAVSRMVCSLGISRMGIDFGTLDGEHSHIFIMVLMPESVTDEYTKLTGGLLRALDEKGRAALMSARSGSEAIEFLSLGMGGTEGRRT